MRYFTIFVTVYLNLVTAPTENIVYVYFPLIIVYEYISFMILAKLTVIVAGDEVFKADKAPCWGGCRGAAATRIEEVTGILHGRDEVAVEVVLCLDEPHALPVELTLQQF